jgi:hypothetical protein
MSQSIAPCRVVFMPLLAALTASVFACSKSSDDKVGSGESVPAGVAANAGSVASAGEGGIVVNGVKLNDETIQQLQQVYPVQVPPGRYWYDGISGAWGHEGEPIAGQMMPGLALGGTLASDASRGTSGIFINGRQITAGEKAYIEMLCQRPAVTGRYWIMATGVGGFEGGPAFFNLSQCPGVPQQRSGGGGSSTRTYCDPNGACTSTGILGSITTASY